MAVRTLKPTSAGRRFQTVLTFDEITKVRPEKGLVVTKKRSGGRNAQGRITTRHIGGGHKRKIRLVDFRREKFGIPAKVAAIEYDPNRSARLALLHYRDGEKRYIIAPLGLRVDDTVMSGPNADVLPGNALPLRAIPAGTTIMAGGYLAVLNQLIAQRKDMSTCLLNRPPSLSRTTVPNQPKSM